MGERGKPSWRYPEGSVTSRVTRGHESVGTEHGRADPTEVHVRAGKAVGRQTTGLDRGGDVVRRLVLDARGAVVHEPHVQPWRVDRVLEVVAALNDPQTKQQLTSIGLEVVGNSIDQFTVFQHQEFARWKKVIEVGKITAD